MAGNKQTMKEVVRQTNKDVIFRGLALVLDRAGYQVRRERLKQGCGWKVVSGSCRSINDHLIFVDKKLPQDDQITFLLSKISNLGLKLDEAQLQELPQKWRAVLA